MIFYWLRLCNREWHLLRLTEVREKIYPQAKCRDPYKQDWIVFIKSDCWSCLDLAQRSNWQPPWHSSLSLECNYWESSNSLLNHASKDLDAMLNIFFLLWLDHISNCPNLLHRYENFSMALQLQAHLTGHVRAIAYAFIEDLFRCAHCHA